MNSVSASAASSPSDAAVAIAVVGALLALACVAWGIASWRAYEPHWRLSMRHALGEIGLRASATWAELADWVKLGR
jgi:hypothetical protein